MTNTVTVEIPADVRDNSQTVTDYAFMRHRCPLPAPTWAERDRDLAYADTFGYTHYQWHDTAQGNSQGWGAGQRMRFDMLVNRAGEVVHLYVTEYWTRVACGRGDWCHSYASHYTVISNTDGDESNAVPYCDRHVDDMRRHVNDVPSLTLHLSERLFVGQHD